MAAVAELQANPPHRPVRGERTVTAATAAKGPSKGAQAASGRIFAVLGESVIFPRSVRVFFPRARISKANLHANESHHSPPC